MQNRKNVSKGALLAGLLLLLPAALLTLFLFARPKPAPDAESGARTAEAAQPYLVEKESYFSDFAVVDDYVYFLCQLTIRNPSDASVPVKIMGDFSADGESGLILGQGLVALRLDDGTGADFLALDGAEQKAIAGDRSRLLFLLQPGDNSFWAVFSGLHGEASVKQDRLLPQIFFSSLVDVTPEEVAAAMDCRIFKDPDEGDAFLLDGEEIFALAFGFGGYGFTSAVPFDSFGLNEVPDLLFTYSWGSGMHRSHLAIFSRTTRETQDLYVYYSYGVQGGSDLLVEWVTDERGASSYTVYTADVTVNGDDYTDLSFTKRAKAGVVAMVLPPAGGSGGGPVFEPDEAFHGLSTVPTVSPVLMLPPDVAEKEGFGCEVEFGGEAAWIPGKAAEALYRICLDAMEPDEQILTPSIPVLESKPWLRLAFRVIPASGMPEETDFNSYLGTFWVYYDFDGIYALFSPNPYASINAWYRFPAGTYDALLEVLTRNGVLSTSPGERIEGNEIYGVFENDGVYAVHLYDRAGALVWAYGPVNRRPEVKQEEDLWSVSVQAGTGIGTRWTVYYAPEEGLLSPAYYGVLARQGERLVRALGNGTLELCIMSHPGAGAVLHEFSEARAAIVDPFLSAAFTEDGRAVTVTYLAGEDYHEVTETIPLPEEFCP